MKPLTWVILDPYYKIKNRLKKNIKKVEKKPNKLKKIEKKPLICEICNKKLGVLDLFKCKYCHKVHCEKHRLPENHNCSGHPIVPKT